MISQSSFTFFIKVEIDGSTCVTKAMRFSLGFSQELHIKHIFRVIWDARIICSEIHLYG